MIDLQDPEVAFAVEAVQQASSLVRMIQDVLVTPAITKEDRSPVTIADFASQALIGYMLSNAFPQDFMIAEEDSSALRKSGTGNLAQVASFVQKYIPDATSEKTAEWIDFRRVDTAERFWTLDPIDGTKGFLRGDQYAIAFALVEDAVVQIGVLGCPNLTDARTPDKQGAGTLVIAVRGEGTWMRSLDGFGEFSQLHVSDQRDPKNARILRSYESGHTNVNQIDDFAKVLGVQVDPVRMDSQAKYALLAAGAGELLLRMLSPAKPDYKEKIWDQAAGSIILEEAGGRVTDLDGKPLDYSKGRKLLANRGLLASNGYLHSIALEALKTIGA